ncbi:MAG: HlyD family efflux transporter periplasmic adaptor subunit [Methylococcaceae bacterium]|nr:HlyD family efflux transporter periplasmic adaptor subunit [Prolixibacteraceae bacterium]
MNTITGITSFKGKRQKINTAGRWKRLSRVAIACLIFSGCTTGRPDSENQKEAKSDVEVIAPIIRPTTNYVSFQGITRFMQANDIRSQLTGTVTRVNCAPAENITVHQALFVIQPQEAAVLEKTNLADEIKKGMTDTIYSHLNGQIKSLNVQTGDFVQAGDILASCVRSNSMKIIAYVPVEQMAVIEKTKACQILLPDGTETDGRVSGKLPEAEAQNQTVAYIIEPKKAIPLSENINLTVQFTTGQIQDALLVPASAVMGNEEQTSFWIMKLADDSTCIKIPVQKGVKTDSLVQIITKDLMPSDLIISEGAYGLADSARVHVTNKR